MISTPLSVPWLSSRLFFWNIEKTFLYVYTDSRKKHFNCSYHYGWLHAYQFTNIINKNHDYYKLSVWQKSGLASSKGALSHSCFKKYCFWWEDWCKSEKRDHFIDVSYHNQLCVSKLIFACNIYGHTGQTYIAVLSQWDF